MKYTVGYKKDREKNKTWGDAVALIVSTCLA